MAFRGVGPVSGARPIETMEAVRHILSLATLQRTRALLRSRRARLLAAAIAVIFVFVSMLIGQMLTFPGFASPSFMSVQWTGSPWWDFPDLFIYNGGVALDLLLLPTVTMILVSAGVGIGLTAALFTAFPRLRAQPQGSGRGTATTSTAGAGAAITGLATLGACCCTTCVSAAGVAVVAAASGTNVALLLGQTWYLELFQLVVVGLALLALERSLRLPTDYCRVAPRVDSGFVLGSLLRIGLLVAGITWSLAMFVEWVEVSPFAAGPTLWYHWIVEHQLLSLAAVAAGMFPKEAAAWVRRIYARTGGWALRIGLLAGGITWGIGVPPPLSGVGLAGLVNEILGFLGASAAWGAVTPDVGLGPALLFHWVFQHLLLGAFAMALALAPAAALGPLRRTVDGEEPDAPSASVPQRIP